MKTFYRKEMNVPGNYSFSPSAGKPALLMKFLVQNSIYPEYESLFTPLSKEDFFLAHDPGYVSGIFDLSIKNGFGNNLESIAKSLPFTSGSFYSAAFHSLNYKENTFSPTSGFHHARYGASNGYCTFNGLMIAALKLKKEFNHLKIGIIDCDQHYGNGTQDIIEKLGTDWINHYTFGAQWVNSENSEMWLIDFQQKMDSFKDVDIIFYQAGADPHIDDPLGGVLTSKQMEKRDEIVFSFFSGHNIPVVWNLAGGYQEPIERVLELHMTTYQIAIKY